MKLFTKILSIVLLFSGIAIFALADKGGTGKKGKTQLNISTTENIKSSMRFNLNSGVTYRGSFLINTEHVGTNTLVSDAMISYKKGNITYIIPYKQKIFIPSYSQKDGYKLIIRPN
ncbi:MAG: hypothetical protein ABI208_08225 [Ginsengibacter sp.]|jgi:hypothetical protein